MNWHSYSDWNQIQSTGVESLVIPNKRQQARDTVTPRGKDSKRHSDRQWHQETMRDTDRQWQWQQEAMRDSDSKRQWEQEAVTTTDNERMSMRDLEVLSSIDPITTTSTGDSESCCVLLLPYLYHFRAVWGWCRLIWVNIELLCGWCRVIYIISELCEAAVGLFRSI